MENSNEEVIISEEVFDTDFDDVGWEPEIVGGDEDEDMAHLLDF